MSINIFLSPTIQLCTNKRDCGEPKTQSKDFPLFSLIFLNVQWPYGSLIFNIFATSTSILYLKSARIFGPWNWLATWVKLKFNTILRWYSSTILIFVFNRLWGNIGANNTISCQSHSFVRDPFEIDHNLLTTNQQQKQQASLRKL